jgi:putative ABC transport system ATP-binding protein
MSHAIQVQNLTKRYTSGTLELTVLSQVSFTLEPGATCAIMGPSGSGKTTLLGLCAGLDQPSEGAVTIHGYNLADWSEEERAKFRRESIGFVFQSFRLLSTLTALENVLVPLELLGQAHAKDRAIHWLKQVGLENRMNHFPSQLSGGEQQRVGLARAFVHNPKLLFADEPTGNLDKDTGDGLVNLMFDLNRQQGTTLIVVTHDETLAQKTGRVLRLSGGRLVTI